MKKIYLFALFMLLSLAGYAQRSPEHPLDIKDARTDQLNYYLEYWLNGSMKQPEGVTRIDDEFYISRVRKLPRITDGDYRIHENVDPKRKLCLWVPMDDPTNKWKSLPRYCFEGDNFSLWSYVDIHGNWSQSWFRCTAGLADVAHKNGVSVGSLLNIPWNANIRIPGTGQYAKLFEILTKHNGATYTNAAPLVKLMKYYGFEGIGLNSEFNSNMTSMNRLIGFFNECHKEGKKIGFDFQVYWYDYTNDYGRPDYDQGLGSHNSKLFGNADNVTVDMMFANYNWHAGLLKKSEETAASLNRSSYDYYAGFDIQKSGLQNLHWQALIDSKISVGFWGAHSQSLIHQSATDDGTADIAIQKAYLKKQELIFSGGNRNPGLLPDIRGRSLANANLEGQYGFHGLARLLTAKSTIQQVPFVTRFNLGNGLSFRKDGKITFDHKWYNINTQDYMPTWRWWITDRNDVVTQESLEGLIKAELTFDDAWWGGSCLSLSGATEFSRVKLFKTLLRVEPNYEFSLTYKTLNGTHPHAKLFVALKGATNSYKEVELPATTAAGEWFTAKFKASELNLQSGDEVAMIGLVLENTTETDRLLVGELALRNPEQRFDTKAPVIKEVDVMRGRYNACDFKVRYASKEEVNGEKVYNDEVYTWYYEIYFQQTGQKPQLLTATTSWAAYVIDVPMLSGMDKRSGKIGVRAVSPDGINGSEIVWHDTRVEYNQPLTDVVIDRPVIKPNEQFTMRYLDTMTPAAQKWEVVNPQNGEVVASADAGTSCTMSIAQEGLYDLRMTDASGVLTTTRGKIQITPEATGCVPEVTAIRSNKPTATTDETVTYTYEARKGEGSVSRGLVVKDPEMFMIPGDVQQGRTYSYALWFKADKFTHDKQGTNLINKNTIKDKWPHNNWGDLWVTIRPEWLGRSLHPANEISFNTMGWEKHDDPNENIMTTGYSVTPGIWNHVVVTHDHANNQKIYFNGKKICETNFHLSKRREEMSDGRILSNHVANIFIGGGGVYKAGFVGVIDEVQVWNKVLSDEEVLQAMRGYKEGEVPSFLQGYYTFEQVESDGSFKNLGHGGEHPGKIVVIEGSGGENTANAGYEPKKPDNTVLGFPGIEGTLEIKATAKWVSDGMTISSETDNTAVVTYATPGNKTTTLTLTNKWGEAAKTEQNIVEITGEATGIETLNQDFELTAYPNPFVESVNLRFAQDGRYTINIFDAKGTRLQTNSFDAQAAQVVNVTIKGNAGMYVVQILKDNKPCKSLKLIKK